MIMRCALNEKEKCQMAPKQCANDECQRRLCAVYCHKNPHAAVYIHTQHPQEGLMSHKWDSSVRESISLTWHDRSG